MITSGLSILPIMRAGGWKSTNVVGRYVEHADLGPLVEAARSGSLKAFQAERGLSAARHL
jgi:hypothetical protein